VFLVDNLDNTSYCIICKFIISLLHPNFPVFIRLNENSAVRQLAQRMNVQLYRAHNKNIRINHNFTKIPDQANARVEKSNLFNAVSTACGNKSIFHLTTSS
jgi:hypothetical protein